MHTISEKNFLLQVEPILYRIFIGNNDTEPFLPHIEKRLLLYFPFIGNSKKDYYWERKLAESLTYANQKIGDSGCYLVSVWKGNVTTYGGLKKNRYAYIPQSELIEAIAAPPGSSKRVWSKLNISNSNFCLCSTNGNWGLLTTFDDHAFLGGTSEFMQAVKSYFPDIEQEVYEYLRDLRLEQMDGEKINIKWLRQVLSHVYGSTIAEQMLIDSSLI